MRGILITAVVLSVGQLGCAGVDPAGEPGCELCDDGEADSYRLVPGSELAWAQCQLQARDDGVGPVYDLGCSIDPRTVSTEAAWAELNTVRARLDYANGEIDEGGWLRGGEPSIHVGSFYDHFDNLNHPFPGTLTVIANSPGGEYFEMVFEIEGPDSPESIFEMPFDVWEVEVTGTEDDVRRVMPSVEFAFSAPDGVTYSRDYSDDELVPAATRMTHDSINALRVPREFDQVVAVGAKVYRRGQDTAEVSVEVAGPGLYDVAPAAEAVPE